VARNGGNFTRDPEAVLPAPSRHFLFANTKSLGVVRAKRYMFKGY